VNVRADDLGRALAVARRAAGDSRALRITIGPPATFLPDNPTLYLRVDGDDDAVGRLRHLRDRVFAAPLERPLTWPFVPHVTVADGIAVDRIDAALTALADYSREVDLERLHVLEERRDDDGQRRWHELADYPLRPTVIVGRGGLPLELTVSEIADPEVLAFEQAQTDAPAVPEEPHRTVAVVVAARRSGEVVGVARGWTDGATTEVTTVLVAAAHRRQGIARHLWTAARQLART
jgi:ribosomal protein S18 acetylase RimI-like enzyme